MFNSEFKTKVSCFLVAVLSVAIPATLKAQVSLYDGPAGDAIGFTFESFDAGLTETGTSIVIDVESFGGCGTDIPIVTVDDPTAQLRIVYRVLADNDATRFDLALRDNDGDDSAPGLGSEEYIYPIDVGAGNDLGGGLLEQFTPFNAFVFRQQSFGFDNDGDTIPNFGLDQWRVQSVFGATDRLNIEIESLEIVFADSVFIYNGCAGDTVGFTFDSFIFGLEETGMSFIVEVNSFGGTGLGIGQTNIDASTSQIRVVYRVLANNVAPQFDVVLQDNDGDDTGPGLGNEEYQYPFLTNGGSPLGDGFEEQFVNVSDFVFRQQSFGFINDGDGELNFGLVQWNLQSSFGATDVLNVEIKSIEIVSAPDDDCLLGDVNLDEEVNLLDVSPFVTLITSGVFQKEADINGDDVVDLLDVAPFVSIITGG